MREDKTGLHVWAVAQPRTWLNDLAVEMDSGLVDQMSFAFTIRDGGDDWAVAEDGTVVRTIRADGVDELFDVSVVTYPAYPQTDVGVRELRNAVESGRLPASVLGEPAPTDGSAPLLEAVDAPRSTAGGAVHRERALRRARMAISKTPTPRETTNHE